MVDLTFKVYAPVGVVTVVVPVQQMPDPWEIKSIDLAPKEGSTMSLQDWGIEVSWDKPA